MDDCESYNKQLVIDFSSNEVVEEPLNYWKDIADVPKEIIDYIITTTKSRVLHDIQTNKYYCPRCLTELNDDFCVSCHYVKPAVDVEKNVIDVDINDSKSLNSTSTFLVFDIIDNQVLLYVFYANNYYDSCYKYTAIQSLNINIEKVYLVSKLGVKDFLTNETYLYQDYEKTKKSESFNERIYDTFENMYSEFLYTDNLYLLKSNPLYKYSNIWELANYYNLNHFDLAALTYYPICCKQFEYLIKMKLYSLAINGADIIDNGHSFKSVFGINKSNYDFMKKIDITPNQLLALRLCSTTDINLLKYIAHNIWLFQELSQYVSVIKIKEYIDCLHMEDYGLYEYYDYINCCVKLGLNLKDKSVLFPLNFVEQHDKVTKEIVIASDPKINNKIKIIANKLSANKYDDGKYVIFPADSIESLIDESSQMSNCVRTYCERFSKNECQIYFMRYKNDISKSYVTIEVRNGKITQAKTRLNGIPSNEIMCILKKWESKLVANI